MPRLNSSRLIHLLRGIVCDNQNKLSQYMYFCSEKHKRIKDIVSVLSSVAPSELYNSIKELESGLIELEQYAYCGLEEVFSSSFIHMSNYFLSDSDYLPRACIKVITENGVAPLVRKPESFAFMEEFNASSGENSAFDTIMHDPAKHYLCNNIPKAARSDEYRNKRLNQALLQEMWEIHPNGIIPDDDWRRCWKRVSFIEQDEVLLPPIEPPIEMCYRSTLVVPLSLSTQTLGDDFISQFEISRNSKIAVFGFLCFDHPEMNFFEPEDIDFGYITADLLSLYIIQQLMYTDYSSIYRSACRAVAEYHSEAA